MAIIKCPHCGQPVSDKADICPHCSKQITVWFCPECNHDVKDNENNCPYCGNPCTSFRKRVQLPTPSASEEVKKDGNGLNGKTKLFWKKIQLNWKKILLISICPTVIGYSGIFVLGDTNFDFLFVVIIILALSGITGVTIALVACLSRNEACSVCGNIEEFENYDEYIGERQISKIMDCDRSAKPCNPYNVFGTEYHYISHHKCKKCGHDKTEDTYRVDWHY